MSLPESNPSYRLIVEALLARAESEPLGVDISDYSDEFCAGFLAGQAHALDEVLRRIGDDEC